jgi:hypothetical protein
LPSRPVIVLSNFYAQPRLYSHLTIYLLSQTFYWPNPILLINPRPFSHLSFNPRFF